MIILSAFDVSQVVGFSPEDPTCALAPIPLSDGTYMLNERVLEDPAHADVREYLEVLPRLADVSMLEIKNFEIPDFEAVGIRGSEQAEAYWTYVEEAAIQPAGLLSRLWGAT